VHPPIRDSHFNEVGTKYDVLAAEIVPENCVPPVRQMEDSFANSAIPIADAG
jgi:hypothetical protein